MRENTLHSMNPPQVPRSDWTRELVPTIIDRRATLEPAAIYAEYPVSTTSYEDGYRSITYKDLANAVNGIAWWLQQNIGPGKDNVKEALAYMGPNDIRYPALIVGAAKVGYMVGIGAKLIEFAMLTIVDVPNFPT